MADDKNASDFEKIINNGRERKKNELLAAKIFNRDRRPSPGATFFPTRGASLASRVGVQKRAASSSPRVGPQSSKIDGEWTHDLHHTVNSNNVSAPTGPASLASRISNSSAGPAGNRRLQRRAAQVAQALIKTELLPQSPARLVNVPPASTRGITIRGLAGPFAVLAQNFAPGTTAADIESAVTPVGGIVSSCRVLKTSPLVVAEIVFESKEGADNVVATFNNQTADGRILTVWHKQGAATQNASAAQVPPAHAPSGPRAGRNNGVVDGSLGFDDPMETDGGDDLVHKQTSRPSAGATVGGRLYSDSIIRGGRRGRGFPRGGRNGSGM